MQRGERPRRRRGSTARLVASGAPHGWRRLLVEPRQAPSRRHAQVRPLVRRRHRLRRRVHGPAGREHRGSRVPDAAARLPRLVWGGDLGRPQLPARPGGEVAAMGRLADMVGRKLLYTYGFAVFIIGSALCGLAPSLLALDGFRVLQAIGAAMLQANSVAIIALAVPRRSLGRAIGIQGAAQAVGLALGPAVGGLLLAAGGWRLLFLVNVPFGLVGMIAGLLPHPAQPRPRRARALRLGRPAPLRAGGRRADGRHLAGQQRRLDVHRPHRRGRARKRACGRLRAAGAPGARPRCSTPACSAACPSRPAWPAGCSRTW